MSNLTSVKFQVDERTWSAALDPPSGLPALLPGTRMAVEDADAGPTGAREISCSVVEAEELVEFFRRAANHFKAAGDPRTAGCEAAQQAIRDAITRASGSV